MKEKKTLTWVTATLALVAMLQTINVIFENLRCQPFFLNTVRLFLSLVIFFVVFVALWELIKEDIKKTRRRI